MTGFIPSLRSRTLYNRAADTIGTFPFFAGFASGVWGFALARALAESFPTSPTFALGPSLFVTLLAVLAGVGGGWWFIRRRETFGEGGPGWELPYLPLLLTTVYLFWPDVAPQVGWTLLGGSLALLALFVARRAGDVLRTQRFATISLTCIVLALYLRTLGPTVGQADTFEFQVVAPTLGVAHPTGYPLYILSGKLFSLLPLGSVAWRVNLTSAVFGTATVVVLYQLIFRLIGRPLLAVIPALAMAFSRVFWSQAVVAEVYALHNLLVASISFLLLEGVSGRWWVSRSPRSAPQGAGYRATKRLNPVYVLSFLLGLSLANHLTTALLLPAVALALLIAPPRLSARNWLVAVGLFFVGLSLYLYVYFRWPMLHDGVWMSPGEFWRYVTGQQFGGALKANAWRTDSTRYQIVGRLLRELFGWPGLLLSAVGVLWLAVKKLSVALVTLLIFLAYAWYTLSYYVPDVAVFLLPAHMVLAVWMGVGLVAVLGLAGYLGQAAGRAAREFSWTGTAVISSLTLLPLGLLWTNLPLVDKSAERQAYYWGDRVLDLPLAPAAAILADSDRVAPLYYLQRIEGRRPDLEILVLADELTYRTELGRRLNAGQTVYLARFLPGLEGLYHLRSVGPLTEVGVEPLLEPPPFDHAVQASFALDPRISNVQGPSIELLGITGPRPGPERGTGLTLYWQANVSVRQVLHVRLRLVDDRGQVWWQEEGRHAANNYYPTPAWRPGEVVADYHEVPPTAVGLAAYPGTYILQVGLFQPFSEEGLSTESGEMWFSLLRLDWSVPGIASDPRHLLRARFYSPGGKVIRFVGADLPDVVFAESSVELKLYEDVSGVAGVKGLPGETTTQVRPALMWADRRGSKVEALIEEAWGRSRLLLQSPASPGDYDLRLGLLDGRGQFLSARCGWLARPTADCVLATVRVVEARGAALANFDEMMLLLSADFDLSVLSPGQTMPLTLSWQGLRRIEEDYTISVQLVGPDGRLYGQTDTWPVQGTLPTSQWAPGQRITDPYHVTLSSEASPGLYRIGVVVYLLRTQARLLIVDAVGQATGDIAWVGELEVVER